VRTPAEGKSVLSGNRPAGGRQMIEADRDVAVQFGNAGAITWTLNGRAGKPLGALGEVKRATVTKDNVTDFVK